MRKTPFYSKSIIADGRRRCPISRPSRSNSNLRLSDDSRYSIDWINIGRINIDRINIGRINVSRINMGPGRVNPAPWDIHAITGFFCRYLYFALNYPNLSSFQLCVTF
ncbi:hypothetical protein LY76DRAFT_29111 [Colletotrichum caudatum]|nr:hypothetical protein LY76DRAFT_29111 [Colletotrichum caudatum]